jgi:dTDP-4-amino-4,6-dideoxygalactose transaminase
VAEVLDSGEFILGRHVSLLEEGIARLVGVGYAVGVASGTDALTLAMRAAGIGSGDEVITAPNSFVATASAIVMAGARPVFVDVREDYNLDPAALEAACSSNTRAILPIHLTGRPADMESITQFARRKSLLVIEDCAQAIGARYRGKPVGSWGNLGCFSLHPLKNLNACGDAGIVTTDDSEFAAGLRALRNLGLRTRDECVVWSQNSRLDTIQAAMLLIKLKYLSQWTDQRRHNALLYRRFLSGLAQVQCPEDRDFEWSVYHTFVIQAERRDELKDFLAKHGIGTAIHYPVPIHLQAVAHHLGYRVGSFPVAERLAKRILSLPVYPELSEERLRFVADKIRTFYAGSNQ